MCIYSLFLACKVVTRLRLSLLSLLLLSLLSLSLLLYIIDFVVIVRHYLVLLSILRF